MQPDGCAARAPKGERREANQAMSTAERRAKAHLRYQRFLPTKDRGTLKPLSSKQGQKQIAETQTQNTLQKRAACLSGRTVSDEIQQLQTTTRSLISRAKFRVMRAEYLNAVFPHMGEQSQKYRTKNLLTEDSRKSTIVFTFSFSFSA